ncbi:MAG TPA: succinate dehydrogenase, cytochrome b556 subunit [Accumulibacter sp.]|uniref:Succinate dehydrogenase cytochrome b556 subunit n=2 Tax=Candidatus Accumulibacter TaxID=327159 RepID=A0A080MAC2_9PROT|nr:MULTISPECIES: succinate dehydrogenase, cytochrome b556 subunit [Candidatus Accumulibacter]KFB77941.1 MAG: Succinate dehydrogenase cytochrome b556 subunit [Candidatus Accumulibacter cognatus]MBL8402655.1 succinate dehydrogenase, cytochrome b556 subunit [Accumulibacter sp.]MBN8519410.1 succinate dehydrogenase, cytochrome b556 subunit [Accumulibacter sp.]MBO3710827.1 succinate dehydrogenase, cytochrome b556 subunit [Accumulibacter sp.]MCC2868027.1 succinate dehydrogenase, cytochrome b556 subun
MAEMAIKKKRPKNLDLPTIRLPLPGILSIIHRISGAGLFLLLPFLLWLFQGSLTSPETFASVKGVVAHPLVKIVLLGLIWFYMHHFCAGIRYLLLDLHKGIELEAARLSSKVVFAVSIALTLIVGAKVLW